MFKKYKLYKECDGRKPRPAHTRNAKSNDEFMYINNVKLS